MDNPPETAIPHIPEVISTQDVSLQISDTIRREELLPEKMLLRLHSLYPASSRLTQKSHLFFFAEEQYAGLSGFRQLANELNEQGIALDSIAERELFIQVYRFRVTGHLLKQIDWNSYAKDPLFHLVFPQPGMIDEKVVAKYIGASSALERTSIAQFYSEHTNAHGSKQLLNKPWFTNEEGEVEVLPGSQHKYPQVQLIFDKQTQHCFSFCTYCFRHGQVCQDHEMLVQEDVAQIHEYLRKHTEVSDLLITGGDAGYITKDRLAQYVRPLKDDPSLKHIRTIRLGSRLLTFQPERILNHRYDEMLELFADLQRNGLTVMWMAHFSTPNELLNASTIAAIRRLQKHGVTLRGQSPMIRNVNIFFDEEGNLLADESAKSWIDMAKIFGTLQVGFHSVYCARQTGEFSYFSAPLSDVHRVFEQVYRELPSVNRPSRHVSMTISAGKVSMIGTVEINGRKAFALKFTEARNMKWIDQVFLAEYDETTSRIDQLKPFFGGDFFYCDELKTIETELAENLDKYI